MGRADDAGDGEEAPHLRRGASVGRYVILGRVGAGAMGEVYAAYDPELYRKLAIMRLCTFRGPATQNKTHKARLLREARAIAKLSHPNVVVVHDFGSIGDRVFIAMEFLDGATLAMWQHAAPRKWREVVELFLAAGRGLQCAHEADLQHRDFKPENVMVGRDGQVRVMDFGLVQKLNSVPESGVLEQESVAPVEPDATLELGKQHTAALRRDLANAARPSGASTAALQDDTSDPGAVQAGWGQQLERLPRTGALVGTPAYMAPEQFLGEPLDARSADLTREPRARRRNLLASVVAGGLLIGGGLAVRASLGKQRAVCQVPLHRFDGVWERSASTSSHREAIRQAFLVTGKDYSDVAFGAVAGLLDR